MSRLKSLALKLGPLARSLHQAEGMQLRSAAAPVLVWRAGVQQQMRMFGSTLEESHRQAVSNHLLVDTLELVRVPGKCATRTNTCFPPVAMPPLHSALTCHMALS